MSATVAKLPDCPLFQLAVVLAVRSFNVIGLLDLLCVVFVYE